MNDFERKMAQPSKKGLYASKIQYFQVNLGLVCNQACRHCHLNCSPERTEVMKWRVMKMILSAAETVRPELVDLTGGAPELNPDFRRFVGALRERDIPVQVRTNLTVITEPGMEDLPDYYREEGIQLVGSLPCYLEENVRAQRGERVYEKSIEALKMLNRFGYGVEPDLILNLVYNPGGPFLPGDQSALEKAYRKELMSRFDLRFTNLLTITNMPIGRFKEELRVRNEEKEYMELLRNSFNPTTVDGLMCRYQISFGWDGTMYDCDFNLALGFSVDHGAPDHINKFDASILSCRRIVTGSHCFGCTAGSGSSCGGALVDSGA
ncbi:MAG: arsenosugar biosynthesis radical SAM (seleno)protein ArsS [bacterium]